MNECVVKHIHMDSNWKLELAMDILKEVIFINPFISYLMCIMF